MKGSDDLSAVGATSIHVSIQRGHVGLDLADGFALVLHEVHGLETAVVVGEHEHVLEMSNDADAKGANNICVDEAADIGRFVDWWRGVTMPGCVGFHTVCARGTLEFGDFGGYINAVGAETLED